MVAIVESDFCSYDPLLCIYAYLLENFSVFIDVSGLLIYILCNRDLCLSITSQHLLPNLMSNLYIYTRPFSGFFLKGLSICP